MKRGQQQLLCLLEVIVKPGSFILAFVVAALMVGIILWLPNWHLLLTTLFSPTLEGGEKFRIFVSLLGSLETNFTTATRLYLFMIASLIGVQSALTLSYIQKVTKQRRSWGLPLTGVIGGIIGIGCVSCGSILLTSILGIGATAALLGALPFQGHELGVVSISILIMTLWYTTRKMTAPEVCAL